MTRRSVVYHIPYLAVSTTYGIHIHRCMYVLYILLYGVQCIAASPQHFMCMQSKYLNLGARFTRHCWAVSGPFLLLTIR